MYKKNGFTLLELLVIISIVGILATLTTVGMTRVVRDKNGEKDVLTFWMELRSLQAIVMRENSSIVVLFDKEDNNYTIYIDKNGNQTLDTGEKWGRELNLSLEFGISSPAPTTLPPNVVNSNIISKNWQDNGFTISNNSTLTLEEGYIYVKNSFVNEICYVIAVARTTAEVKLYKWDGGRWLNI